VPPTAAMPAGGSALEQGSERRLARQLRADHTDAVASPATERVKGPGEASLAAAWFAMQEHPSRADRTLLRVVARTLHGFVRAIDEHAIPHACTSPLPNTVVSTARAFVDRPPDQQQIATEPDALGMRGGLARMDQHQLRSAGLGQHVVVGTPLLSLMSPLTPREADNRARRSKRRKVPQRLRAFSGFRCVAALRRPRTLRRREAQDRHPAKL
jgi:hypothetical protein